MDMLRGRSHSSDTGSNSGTGLASFMSRLSSSSPAPPAPPLEPTPSSSSSATLDPPAAPPSQEIYSDSSNVVTLQSDSPALPPAVVMTWAGVQPAAVPNTTVLPTPNNGPVPSDLPPNYEVARVPTQALTYTFSPQGFNSMLLLPPADAQDTRPIYHISVAMNCFIPTSYITTLRRGASEYGEYIGDFQMGISNAPELVTYRTRQLRLKDCLQKHLGYYRWEVSLAGRRRKLKWLVDGLKKTCWLAGNSSEHETLFAQFNSQPLVPGIDSAPVPPATIKVYPAAYVLLDLVILSALVLERKRLMPTLGT